ncbi:unnamed protein product [Caretta caretta]
MREHQQSTYHSEDATLQILEVKEDGVQLFESHQVFSLPVQPPLLYPGCCDPGLWSVDLSRQKQFYFSSA